MYLAQTAHVGVTFDGHAHGAERCCAELPIAPIGCTVGGSVSGARAAPGHATGTAGASTPVERGEADEAEGARAGPATIADTFASFSKVLNASLKFSSAATRPFK